MMCVRVCVRARKGKCPGFVMVVNAGLCQSPIRKETRVLVGNGWRRKGPMPCRQLCYTMLNVNCSV